MPAPGSTERTLVSVVILNHNRASALKGCLASIASQTYRPLEVLLLDAGSEDESLEVASEAFGAMERRGIATRLEHTEPMGVAAARNHGARLSSGEITCFIDNDAEFESDDSLHRAAAAFLDLPTLAVLDFRALNGDSNELDPFAWVHRRPSRAWAGKSFRTFTFAGTGFAVRKSVFLDVGGFWDHLLYSREEEELCFALIDRGYDILYSPEPTVRHYFDPRGRVDLRNRRALEYRNGVLVLWRRLPLPLAVGTIFGRTVTMSFRGLKEDRRLPTHLYRALIEAMREWRECRLDRRPIRFRSALRYAALHRAS